MREKKQAHTVRMQLLSQQLWEIKNQKMRWKASEDEHVVAASISLLLSFYFSHDEVDVVAGVGGEMSALL